MCVCVGGGGWAQRLYDTLPETLGRVLVAGIARRAPSAPVLGSALVPLATVAQGARLARLLWWHVAYLPTEAPGVGCCPRRRCSSHGRRRFGV